MISTLARTVVTAAVVLVAVTAHPAVAAGAEPTSTGSRQGQPCPPGSLKPDALEASIGGLPDTDDAISAQVRLVTPDGCWNGRNGNGNLHPATPVPAGARFRVGSVTKVFTAALVLQLAAEHRVELDAPVRRYLRHLLPQAYDEVTVRQLLDHTHGMPNPPLPDGADTVEWQIEHRFDTVDPAQLVRGALAAEPDFAPGARQRYTNMGYLVAGLLIEQVTGHTYADELQRRITRPLLLTDTYAPGDDPCIRGPHAHGYQQVQRNGGVELVDVTQWNQSSTFAAGDLISTVADLDTFTHALFTGRLLAPAQLAEMFKLPTADATYGIGLQVTRLPDGRELWGKSGARYGYSALIAATRDGRSRVIYSVTSTDAKAETTSKTVQGILAAVIGALPASIT